MSDALIIKICGLSTPDTLQAAMEAGADMVGFVFFKPSPRNLTFEQAKALGQQATGKSQKVALSVDADNALLDTIAECLQPDLLQLHGKESPQRVAAIKARFGLPVMKAIHVSQAADLQAMQQYQGVADWYVFDAKPPKDAALPGGNGMAFDWTILQNVQTQTPWMLSGGLNKDNVTEAIRIARPPAIDVSSGVESAKGVKNVDMIRGFIKTVRSVGM